MQGRNEEIGTATPTRRVVCRVYLSNESPSSPQGLETRSRKRARTRSASSPPADSNCTLGAVVDAQRDISRVTTDSYQGNTASSNRTWLQSIYQQTTGKPAYTSYIGAKVTQHFETG